MIDLLGFQRNKFIVAFSWINLSKNEMVATVFAESHSLQLLHQYVFQFSDSNFSKTKGGER
jgi:hypothetical protein